MNLQNLILLKMVGLVLNIKMNKKKVLNMKYRLKVENIQEYFLNLLKKVYNVKRIIIHN